MIASLSIKKKPKTIVEKAVFCIQIAKIVKILKKKKKKKHMSFEMAIKYIFFNL